VTDDVVQVPDYKIDFLASYTVPKLLTRLDFSGIWADESFTQLPTPEEPDTEVLESDEYLTLNMRVSQPFLDHFEAYAAVNNIADNDYEPEDGFPAPGRNYWVGLAGRF
jgi:outer membrane receptor protein involved in Fe transport